MTWWIPDHIGEITTIATTLATIFMATFTFFLYKSTNKLWKASKDSLEQTERAFVFLDGFTPELTTVADSNTAREHLPERWRGEPGLFITRFAVQPRWKNGGNTPTVDMTMCVHWQFIARDIPPGYSYANTPKPFFIPPQAIEPSTFLEIPTTGVQGLIDYDMGLPKIIPVPHDDAHIVIIDPKLLIWGRADYKDIFGRVHYIEWCYEVRFERHDGKKLRAGFIQWGDYNRSN